MLLTHGHIDHCGLIPKLYKQGFTGKIYTTGATLDVCQIILEDSAMIQERNIEEENKRRKQNHQEPRVPMYSVDDAKACMKLFQAIEYRKIINITDTIQARFQDAGHIL